MNELTNKESKTEYKANSITKTVISTRSSITVFNA